MQDNKPPAVAGSWGLRAVNPGGGFHVQCIIWA